MCRGFNYRETDLFSLISQVINASYYKVVSVQNRSTERMQNIFPQLFSLLSNMQIIFSAFEVYKVKTPDI